jgi:molecular chaperone DnaJ
MGTDFYKILGVSKGASQEEIKNVYRKLARKWHPDINPGNKEAEQRFKEISRAYDCLGDEKKRRLYDEFGENGLQPGFDAEKARQYQQWQSFQQGGEKTRAEGFGRYQSYEDIFGDLFGRGSQGYDAGGAIRGRDLEHDMSLDLVASLKGLETELSMRKMSDCEACQGSGMDPNSPMSHCTRCSGSGRINVAQGPMTFTKPCPQCHGHGQIGKPCSRCRGSGQILGTEVIKVTIPKGVREGSKVRVAGKGEPGRNGGPPGDLYLIVHINAHPFLKRDGDNLLMDVPVTIREAMAGGQIQVPTVEGPIKVKVPPKSQNGQTLRLREKGAVNIKTKKRGDLLVRLVIKVPQTEDAEVLEAAKKMDRLYKKDIRGGLRL